MIARWMNDDILGRVQDLKPIASDLGLTMAQLAVAWVLHHRTSPRRSSKASRPGQMTENVKASGVTLTDDDARPYRRGARRRRRSGSRQDLRGHAEGRPC